MRSDEQGLETKRCSAVRMTRVESRRTDDDIIRRNPHRHDRFLDSDECTS